MKQFYHDENYEFIELFDFKPKFVIFKIWPDISRKQTFGYKAFNTKEDADNWIEDFLKKNGPSVFTLEAELVSITNYPKILED